MRIGLVLGGGGIPGLANHAGALAAVEHDLRWDLRGAEIVVGTSPGSVIGTMIRAGIPGHDLVRPLTGDEPEHRSRAADDLIRMLGGDFMGGDDLVASPASRSWMPVSSWARLRRATG